MGALELPDDGADIVTGSYALRNAPVVRRALAEIHRVLKRGGIAASLDFSKPASLRRQQIELAILRLWGSFWGKLLHRDPDTYAYIAESLRQFPDRESLYQLCSEAGFEIVTSKLFYFGVVECLVPKKRANGARRVP